MVNQTIIHILNSPGLPARQSKLSSGARYLDCRRRIKTHDVLYVGKSTDATSVGQRFMRSLVLPATKGAFVWMRSRYGILGRIRWFLNKVWKNGEIFVIKNVHLLLKMFCFSQPLPCFMLGWRKCGTHSNKALYWMNSSMSIRDNLPFLTQFICNAVANVA